MPVKISSIQSDDPRVITFDEYQFGRDNFQMHYYKSPGGPEANVFAGQDFTVPWDDFYGAVYDFYTANSIDPEDVALRFVHCYDENNNCLFLRLQICSLGTPYFNTEGYQVFPLVTTPCAWYELNDGTIASTGDTTLKGSVYFENLYYKADPGTENYEKLADGVNKYVENFVYPWASEVYAMYTDNEEPEDASIHFASCSYTDPPVESNVVWPHGNVLYLSTPTHTYLNNDESMVLFSNKGCDMGSLCPPNCDVYINPVLPQG